MKENNFYSDDFEDLIRGKTEQYKMYPSENVWKGVHSALHTKRKWFIGSMALLVTGTLFMAGRELILPSHNTAHKTAVAGNTVADAAKSTNAEISTPIPLAVLRPANTTSATRHGNDSGSSLTTEEIDPAVAGLSITISHPVLTQSDLSEWLSHVVRLPEQAPDLDVIAARTPVPDTAAGGAAIKATGDDQRIAGDNRTANAEDQR